MAFTGSPMVSTNKAVDVMNNKGIGTKLEAVTLEVKRFIEVFFYGG